MQKMIRVAIIEDEPAIRKEIKYLVEQEADTQLVGWADSVATAYNLIQETTADVVLMDIQLRDGTAFDLLKKLDPIPQNIIFITAYNQFAIKAIKYGALDYLLKPIDHSELKEAIDRYRRRNENNPQWMQQLALAETTLTSGKIPETIVLNSLNNQLIVNVKDIVYCKGDGPYTHFHFNNAKEQLISKPLKYYEEILPAPFFLRSHQSYLVNCNYVTGVKESEFLLLKNGDEIPISMRRRTAILNQILSKK